MKDKKAKLRKPMSNRIHRREGPGICPSCRGGNVSRDDCTVADKTEAEIEQKCHCPDCNAYWTDTYALSHYRWR